jgi:hypothetical protein
MGIKIRTYKTFVWLSFVKLFGTTLILLAGFLVPEHILSIPWSRKVTLITVSSVLAFVMPIASYWYIIPYKKMFLGFLLFSIINSVFMAGSAGIIVHNIIQNTVPYPVLKTILYGSMGVILVWIMLTGIKLFFQQLGNHFRWLSCAEKKFT